MNPVTVTRIHLALCHLPVLTLLFGVGWLALGCWRRSRDLQGAALAMYLAAAGLAVLMYTTGDAAVSTVKGLPGYTDALMEQHEAAAGVALAGHLLVGIAALAGLIQFRNRSFARWILGGLLGVGVVVLALALWTANLGGKIRHSEIRSYEARAE